MRIISVSRRTDIPAHYGQWFERRVEEGFAGWVNPLYGQKYIVSLKREDVAAFAFWSKNYLPFMPVLQSLRALGYPAVFNITVTGLPKALESNVVPSADAVDNLVEISRLYSPEHINWRYDPVVVTSITPPEYHVERFTGLCGQLQGYVKRCYFSFPVGYGHGASNLKRFACDQGVEVLELLQPERVALAQRLGEIAAAHGIEMFTCSGDYLVGGLIKKAGCIDGELISRFFYGGAWKATKKPTRKECGCTASVDIGVADSCPHDCQYCYARSSREAIRKNHTAHEPASAFLGYSKAEADEFIKEIETKKQSKAGAKELAPGLE